MIRLLKNLIHIYLEGCNCPNLNMADVKVKHDMIIVKANDDGMGQRCSKWFGQADQAIRLYTASVRASIISMKSSCCAPWTVKNPKSGKCIQGNLRSTGRWKPKPFATPGMQNDKIHEKKTMGNGAPKDIYSQGMPRWTIYDPIWDCAGVICKNEAFPNKPPPKAYAEPKAD